MKPWYLCSETYAALVPAVFGLLATAGVLTPDKATELTKNIMAIVGVVLTVIPSTIYVKTRTDLKAAVAGAVSADVSNTTVATISERLRQAGV